MRASPPALRAYTQTQDLIFRERDRADLPVDRFLLDRTSHVAVLGEPPPEEVEQRIQAILATGEPAALTPTTSTNTSSATSRSRDAGRRLNGGDTLASPKWPLLGAGVVLVLLGPPVAWSVGAGAAPWDRAAWSFGGAALFALGWLLTGAGLRPRGHVLRGVVLAAILYLVAGWGWLFAFNVGYLGYRGVLRRPGELVDPQTLLLVLTWPLNVAQALGLFGHSFN